MKKNLTRTILALVLLLAVMAGATLGVNAITAPITNGSKSPHTAPITVPTER